MYDVVVIGQGLSGLLSAIWAKEHGLHTAIVATGTGKIIQSTGVMDLVPGTKFGLQDWLDIYQLNDIPTTRVTNAIESFKMLTKRLHYPYNGDIERPVSIVTASGHLKQTALYPETITPIPTEGHVTIVGFKELTDFVPSFIKGNLQKECPQLAIDTITVSLGIPTQRTMTQLDAARLLDRQEIRTHIIKQIKDTLKKQQAKQPHLFVFPASLGMVHWKETLNHLSDELGGAITEAPGMPPNTTAIRLFEALRKEATKLGVRFYIDTTVNGFKKENETIQTLDIMISQQRRTQLKGKNFILATGGVLGGGLEITSTGLKESALSLQVNDYGEIQKPPNNLYPTGASNGIRHTHYGITGGIYSILSSHESIQKLKQFAVGGVWSA